MTLIDSHSYIQREEEILLRHRVHERLCDLLTTADGRKHFAELFYFVRSAFVRHNFLLGTRCPVHEDYWKGIVYNLSEELGGRNGIPHNHLYRRFLRSVGASGEGCIREAKFSKDFNNAWENYIRQMDVEESIYAIVIYEILDSVDYGMLLSALRQSGESALDLEFFFVHARAEHGALFTDFLQRVVHHERRVYWAESAAAFVLETQQNMWNGLIAALANVQTE